MPLHVRQGVDPLAGFRERESWTRQVAENSARLAFASGPVITTGWGENLIEEMIDFGCTFIEQPTAHHGYALSDDDDDEETLVLGRFPRAHGFVRAWETFTDNGVKHYTGAWVAIIVDSIGPAQEIPFPFNDPGYTLEHSFIFSGIAIKDVPAFLADDQG